MISIKKSGHKKMKKQHEEHVNHIANCIECKKKIVMNKEEMLRLPAEAISEITLKKITQKNHEKGIKEQH